MPKVLTFIVRYRLPALLALLLTLAALNSLATVVADTDLWGYLAFGRLFWESGTFPYQDVFSFVPTHNPWIYHEWLTGVLFYPLYRHWGAAGLQLLKFGLGLLTILFIYLTARRREADPVSAVIVLGFILLGLGAGYSPVRAQVFTYFFFALTLYLLENARLHGKWRGLWLLIPLQVIWCNLHGGFLAGLGLTGLYLAGEALSGRRFRAYAVVLALCAAATLINPYGLEYWGYFTRAVAMPRPEVVEWWSVPRALRTGAFLNPVLHFLTAAILAGSLLWRVDFREVTPALALAATFTLGFLHLRHTIFFLMLAGAYVPLALTSLSQSAHSQPAWHKLKGRLSANTPGILVLFLVVAVLQAGGIVLRSPLKLQVPPYPGRGAVYYPVGAVEVIKKNGWTGNLLTEFDWGEYLLWTLYPQCRVALDGRYETVYPETVSRDLFDFYKAKGDWKRVLERYSPVMILVKIDSPVYPRLHQLPWRQVYADSGSALFLRDDKLPMPLRSNDPDA